MNKVENEKGTNDYHFPSIESYEKIAFNFGNGNGGIRPYHLSDIENDPNIFINELNDPEVSEISVVGFIKTSISRDVYLAHTQKEIESLKQRVMNGDLLHNIKNEVDAGLSSEISRENEKYAIESKSEAIDILKKHGKSYDELKRDFQFNQMEYESHLKVDINLAISGNEEVLKKYNLSKDLDEIDLTTEIEYKEFNNRPKDYHELKQDLKDYDKNTDILKNNNYGEKHLNELNKINSTIFKNNLFTEFKEDVYSDRIKSKEELKDKSADYKNIYEYLKDEYNTIKKELYTDKDNEKTNKRDNKDIER